jgi:hypothetical protein
MDIPIEWLLQGPPWVAYRTRIDLMDQPEEDPEVIQAREAMLLHPKVQRMLAELAAWPGGVLKSHKNAAHSLHLLTFVADLGIRADDPGVESIVAKIMAYQSPEGPFQVQVNISPRYGGTGQDQWAWMLCDAPLVQYALHQFGLQDHPQVKAALVHLIGLLRENAWPCAVTPDLGKFRGPGRKADLCPYATLTMLKALSGFSDTPMGLAHSGGEALLELWERRTERRPYLFAMGTDFAKLKAPSVWYDLLHVLDVLTRFPSLHQDPRLQEMAIILKGKADDQGRFQAESIWQAWKDWDFGQKREPSRWITLLAHRIMKRLANGRQAQNLYSLPGNTLEG